MKKNNYPSPDAFSSNTNLVSSTDFTGLVPSGIENSIEEVAYKQMYPVNPEVK